ncbi:ABC transporter substrate-binding protein [Simplicispira psychrophila]|uniref:ABC transporter substrate-binding protein n=1 Tax=Simplicispira psychrophila TaxID=80882 RepID=UPI000B004F4B|nr:helical backbone metal receptor [Simplicispira psychrophila]
MAPAHSAADGRARIVTLTPSLTEAVCALGHCEQLVATDRHSAWPAQVQRLPKVGGLADAHIERIVALRPTLVLLGPRSRAGARLQELGVPVLMLEARNHAAVRRMLFTLGEALGTPPTQVAALVAQMDADLSAAAARLPAALRGRTVYVEISAAPHGASNQSFIGETVARLGLVNVVQSESAPFIKINPELLLRRPPDFIIGARATLTHLAERPGWALLPAVRQRQVCQLDEERMGLLLRPGHRMGEAAHMLVDCLRDLPPPS